MQRTAHLNWLGTLAAVAVLTAGLAQAATITINSGNVVWGSSGTGTAEIRYASGPDAYYLNSNTTTAFINGYKGGLSSESNAQHKDDGNAFLCAIATGTPAVLVWNFDTSGLLIQGMSVKNHTWAIIDSGPSSATWEWSTGGDWKNYASITSPGIDSGFHDLTSYIKGHSNFSIRATLYPEQYNPILPQLFRSGMDTYGLDVIMTVPEPASLGLLALGGLFVLRRRRN
jgi:hypothetical protein